MIHENKSDKSDYRTGLHNGLEMSLSTLENRVPKFETCQTKERITINLTLKETHFIRILRETYQLTTCEQTKLYIFNEVNTVLTNPEDVEMMLRQN